MAYQGARRGRRRGGAPGWWCVCALAWLALACGLAQASEPSLILERAYWQEPCARQRLDQLPQQDFTPYEGMLGLGYGPCAVWVRLLLAPAGAQARTVLRMRPTYLDTIELHDPLAAEVRTTGDLHPIAEGEAPGRALQLTVPGGTAPRHVWLRLETTSTRLLDVQAQAPMAALAQERKDERLQVVFLALLAVSWIWALVQWGYSRERLAGIFVVKQSGALAWALLLMGYGPSLLGGWLEPAAISQLTSVSVLAITSLSIWFDHALLRGYVLPRNGLRWLLGLTVMLPVELVLLFSGQAALALQINGVVVVLAALTSFSLAVCARRGDLPADSAPVTLPQAWLVLFYGLILVAIAPAIGTNLGLLPAGLLAMSALYVHSWLTGIVMMVLLNIRARMQSRALRELGRARAQEQQERVHRQEQEQLVDMLVHELKTPLAAVRMLLGSGQPSSTQFTSVQHVLADMNGVLERCAQASQLDADRLRPSLTPCDLPQMLRGLVARRPEAQRIALALCPALQQAPLVEADAQWLRMIVGNLLDNACKYGPADGPVRIAATRASAEQGAAGVTIEFENPPGPAGWPDPAQVFGKYYRSPHAHRKTGSGLGLYLVAGLVQRLEGRIRYEPSADRVRFRVWLPC